MLKIILCLSLSIVLTNEQLIQSVFDFLNEGGRNLDMEYRQNVAEPSEFDFIIVGAGTAGCALAARLSENPNWTVLLIEAGQHENLFMDIPMMVQYLQRNKDINWGYRPQSSNSSCLAMNDNRCMWPRGRVMGGSSVLNYMMYIRGNRRDYDLWAKLGNTGWGYDDVLPYFKKLENSLVPNATPGMAGKSGPVSISEVQWKSDVAKAFIKANIELGLSYVDYNGFNQIGVSYLQTTTKNGRRTSSNVAYLYPIRDRKNLFIKKMSTVTKILINKNTKTAEGVQYVNKGRYYTVQARNEVVISGGAINSPQLLMLSGVGPADHLKEMNIEPIVDLPVGYNLMDHFAPGGLTFKTNVSTFSLFRVSAKDFIDFTAGTGPTLLGSIGGCESVAFVDLKDETNNPEGWPDIELIQGMGAIHSVSVLKQILGLKPSVYGPIFGELEARQENAFMIIPMVMRPKSKGRIMLKSKNPFTYPLIYSNYFSDPYDMKVAIAGIKRTIKLEQTKAFQEINATFYKAPIPTCAHLKFATDAYWDCHTRHFTFTIYHYSGTCKMGSMNDTTAVVDPRLRVKGIKNLRVVDASIFPEIMAGHPNSAVYMIAEKASDMIKEDWQ